MTAAVKVTEAQWRVCIKLIKKTETDNNPDITSFILTVCISEGILYSDSWIVLLYHIHRQAFHKETLMYF